MKIADTDNTPLPTRFLMAGTAACIADLVTFPLDTAKVRMQIAGEPRILMINTAPGFRLGLGLSYSALGSGNINPVQAGLINTIGTIIKNEGARSLYSGLSAGLQRQMCFASIRLGLYDTFKSLYASVIDGNDSGRSSNLFTVRVMSGLTTGGLAVIFAQPTDVVKVRLQASGAGVRYTSTLQAYKHIGSNEGIRGLWKGTAPNVARNSIVNVAEIVCYDIMKDLILQSRLLQDGIPCHFLAAVAAGLCTTLASSPVDVVKTRLMNSTHGEYKGAIDVAVKTFMNEGPLAFYKGFIPSFSRLVSWNIVLWITYEQIKLQVKNFQSENK